MTIQTTGSFDTEFNTYSISICMENDRLMTLEGFTKEDMIQLRSCINCMLLDEKSPKMTYQEMIDAGFEMTGDGFWIPSDKK
jgi:hypothetical protein